MPRLSEGSYEHIIVAVHGIGKQSRNSTVRSVLSMAGEHLQTAAHASSTFSYPLGYFHSDVMAATKVTPFSEVPGSPESLARVGFSEVFWADIPQEVAKENRTMEETKAWARTVVARAQDLYQHSLSRKDSPAAAEKKRVFPRVPPDFGLASEVLEEIIDTVYVLENLSWLADKAGLMTFDVRKVIEEYLGDVQIVTEFSYYRNDIVGRFHRAMEQIHAVNPNDSIHIVAHSEGTVVSFLGLLHAMSNSRVSPASGAQGAQAGRVRTPPDWIKNVKGFMTIGSPIDKHLLLWPKLWDKFDLEGSKQLAEKAQHQKQIKWHNYYDFGDPVGYKLDTARDWLNDHGDRMFDFDPANDIGFSRYLLPGKAHNDYWDDAEVFEHFIRKVITDGKKTRIKAPPSRPAESVVSVMLPYALSAVLLTIATYISLRGLINYYSPASDPLVNTVHYIVKGQLPEATRQFGNYEIFKECLGWAGLLAGTTVAARVPRLARGFWPLACIAALVGYLSTMFIDGEILTMLIDSTVTSQWPFNWMAYLVDNTWLSFFKSHPGPTQDATAVGTLRLLLCVTSTITIIASYWLGKRERKRYRRDQGRERRGRWFGKGARPLLLIGSTMIALLTIWPGYRLKQLKTSEASEVNTPASLKRDEQKEIASLLPSRPVWPVVISFTAFVYIWWLSILVFDLAFVWQRYVRQGAAFRILRGWSAIGKGDG